MRLSGQLNHIKWLEEKFKNVNSIEDNLSSIYDEFVKTKSNFTNSQRYFNEKQQLQF